VVPIASCLQITPMLSIAGRADYLELCVLLYLSWKMREEGVKDFLFIWLRKTELWAELLEKQVAKWESRLTLELYIQDLILQPIISVILSNSHSPFRNEGGIIISASLGLSQE
jgi:hypothetical protein